MKRAKVAVLVLGLAIGFASCAEAKTRDYPCYWTHGRMSVRPGTPATRISPSGTRRVLGVINREHPTPDDAYAPTLPANVLNVLTPGSDVWGEFYVCPVVAERAGAMRLVFVKEARGLVVGPH